MIPMMAELLASRAWQLRIVDAFAMEQCLIFCRTNYDCDNLERFLNELSGGSGSGFRGMRESGKEGKYSCVVLAGQRSMEERRRALQASKDGDVRLLMCTNVAARGIDISRLPYVVNMTLPDKSEDSIHRVGRVGRADRMGLAISLVAAVPEWYCTIKGYKPWLEPDARNTKTQEQGGQTVYNEPQLLTEVEARLNAPIPTVNQDMSLPGDMQARLKGGPGAYGQARSGGTSRAVTERLESIKQNVQELAALEWQAQTSFLLLKHKWAATASSTGAS
ncbi:P-loop containing nucleoside triphosphate hydrolase protein [Scenedesmus sp. NREL 46B-D3]|nr:P-loop containing nucleoside triphosphate hydrolase protein [Scenedesmus sp. NREL 46B-D3]